MKLNWRTRMSVSEAKTTDMASANSLDDIASLLSGEEQDFEEEQDQEELS